MSIWYQNHPSKELQTETYFHTLWLISIFFTNNSCFLPSFCYNLCYNVNRRVMVKYHDSVYARKSWSAVAFGPVLRHWPGGGCRLYPKEEHRELMDYAVLKKNFENHRFHTSYFETTEEAAAYLSDRSRARKSALAALSPQKRWISLRSSGKKQRSDLALGTGTGCEDQGKRFHRIYPERQRRCRDRPDHQHRRDRKPSFRELIWTETSILCDREK